MYTEIRTPIKYFIQLGHPEKIVSGGRITLTGKMNERGMGYHL